MPRRNNLPSKLRRSSKDVRKTFARTRDSVQRRYGNGHRSGRGAYASLRRAVEKAGDRWARGSRDPGHRIARRGVAGRRLTIGRRRTVTSTRLGRALRRARRRGGARSASAASARKH